MVNLFDGFIGHSRIILQTGVLLLSLPALKMCCTVVLIWIDAFAKYTGINVVFEVNSPNICNCMRSSQLIAFPKFNITEKSGDHQHQCWTRENLYITSTKTEIHSRHSRTKSGTHARGTHTKCNGTIETDCRNGFARIAQTLTSRWQIVPFRFRIRNGFEHKHLQPTQHRFGGDSLWKCNASLHWANAVGCVPAVVGDATRPHLSGIEFGTHRLHCI